MYCRYIYFRLVYCCIECGLFFFFFILYVSICDRIDALAQIPQTLRHRKIYSTTQKQRTRRMAEIRSEDTLQVIHRNMLTYTRGEKEKTMSVMKRSGKKRIWIISEFSNVSRCEYVLWRFWVSCLLIRFEFFFAKSFQWTGGYSLKIFNLPTACIPVANNYRDKEKSFFFFRTTYDFSICEQYRRACVHQIPLNMRQM